MSTNGRPPFEPKPEHRDRVAIAAGGGMAHDVIAAAIGISIPTLRKYFAEELVQGACLKRVEILEALHGTAIKGNVAAQKAYLATSEPRGLAPPAEEGDPAATGEPKPEGKKAQAAADAVTAQEGTDWQDLLGGSHPLATTTAQ